MDDDDDDGVEEEEEGGGWVEDGQWWWWPREEEEEIVDACCLPVNSTGIGRANASLTLGNWPRVLSRKFDQYIFIQTILTVFQEYILEFSKENFVIY